MRRHHPVRRGAGEGQAPESLALFADDADVDFRNVFEDKFLYRLAAPIQDRGDALVEVDGRT